MARVAHSAVAKQVAAVFQVGTAAGLPDGSLLERFRSGNPDEAEASFAALVERHGPMVLHVCRRILRERHDAEDAAQATFLALAQHARSIRKMDSISSWLHGVAWRIANRARRDTVRRRSCERRALEAAMAIHRAVGRETGASLEIHDELNRLPDRFRLPIVLCCLEGLTHEQAAERIGCPVRTVQSRLARGRQRLRERLTRQGSGPAVIPLAGVLNLQAISGLASDRWKQATVKAAARYAAGGAQSALVSATAAALAKGALRTMVFHRLMKWASFLVLIGAASGGAWIAIFARSTPARAEQATTGDAEDRSYRVSMSGGIAVEVVAVSSVPTGPGTWWSPDGNKLGEPPVDAIQGHGGSQDDEASRVILVRASGASREDLFRWNPLRSSSYWGGTPKKDGQVVPGLEYYEVTFPRDRADCAIKARVAAGAWKTEVSNDGRGGFGEFVNGHKFCFGKARPLTARGRAMTVFSVAHNFFGQDRRIVAIDRDDAPHPAVSYSMGSDGDEKWVIDLIDAELPLPPEQIKEYQVQFRPIEVAEIGGIRLNPLPSEGKSAR